MAQTFFYFNDMFSYVSFATSAGTQVKAINQKGCGNLTAVKQTFKLRDDICNLPKERSSNEGIKYSK